MRAVAHDYAGLGLTEIARTVCELLDWKRPNGGLKNHECRQLLERLQAGGVLTLPALRHLGGKVRAAWTYRSNAWSQSRPVPGASMRTAGVGPGGSEAESRLWREHVERYHYLGCRVPFGANLRYWVRNRDRNWPACCGHRQPGKCRREMPGSRGAMSGGNVTCNGSSTMDGS